MNTLFCRNGIAVGKSGYLGCYFIPRNAYTDPEGVGVNAAKKVPEKRAGRAVAGRLRAGCIGARRCDHVAVSAGFYGICSEFMRRQRLARDQQRFAG